MIEIAQWKTLRQSRVYTVGGAFIQSSVSYIDLLIFFIFDCFVLIFISKFKIS